MKINTRAQACLCNGPQLRTIFGNKGSITYRCDPIHYLAFNLILAIRLLVEVIFDRHGVIGRTVAHFFNLLLRWQFSISVI